MKKSKISMIDFRVKVKGTKLVFYFTNISGDNLLNVITLVNDNQFCLSFSKQ